MTHIYDVVAKHHPCAADGISHETILFYDEDRETSIEYMRKYDKQHGFTVTTWKGEESIADLILVEREATGKVISGTPYIELFDVYRNRRKCKNDL